MENNGTDTRPLGDRFAPVHNPAEKQCGRCGKVKSIESFSLKMDRPGFPNRRHSHCVSCRSKQAHRNKRSWLQEYLSIHPCVDCGETDPDVLDFDHRDPATKEYCVTDSLSLPQRSREAAKCDIRCANCHRRRHARDRRAAKCSM